MGNGWQGKSVGRARLQIACHNCRGIAILSYMSLGLMTVSTGCQENLVTVTLNVLNCCC